MHSFGGCLESGKSTMALPAWLCLHVPGSLLLLGACTPQCPRPPAGKSSIKTEEAIPIMPRSHDSNCQSHSLAGTLCKTPHY